MELTPNSPIEHNTNVYIKNGAYTINFFKDAVTNQFIRHICIEYNTGEIKNKIETIDNPNPTYADVLDDTLDYTINRNHYSNNVMETKTKSLYNGDYVTTTDGLYIIDIPEDQSIVTKYPERLIIPLTNIVTNKHITMSFNDIITNRDDAFYHNLYNLYTGDSTETKGYLKAAHQFDKTLKELIDRAILKHALSSKEAFKQTLKDLCNNHNGYINTRGTYDLNSGDFQFYTSLNGDNVITEEAKYNTFDHDIHLIKRTATPLNLYMKRIEKLEPKIKGGLYDAIDYLNDGNRFTQTRHFRPHPKTL